MLERSFRGARTLIGVAALSVAGCGAEAGCEGPCVAEIEASISELLHLPVHCISVRTFVYGEGEAAISITPGVSCEWAGT